MRAHLRRRHAGAAGLVCRGVRTAALQPERRRDFASDDYRHEGRGGHGDDRKPPPRSLRPCGSDLPLSGGRDRKRAERPRRDVPPAAHCAAVRADPARAGRRNCDGNKPRGDLQRGGNRLRPPTGGSRAAHALSGDCPHARQHGEFRHHGGDGAPRGGKRAEHHHPRRAGQPVHRGD